MQIWIHDSKMKKIVALNNNIPEMLHYSNSAWHPYLDQATSTFDFTIPKFVNGKLHEDIKLINDECFVSFYANGSHQVFYIATLQEDDFNIQLTCNNTNLEYALEYANPFSAGGAQTIEWYLNHMDLLSFAAVELGYNEIPDRKRTLTFDSQETKMARLQSLMSNFDAEFEFKTELNRDGTYKRIVINVYQKADETHHGIGKIRNDVILYYNNDLKGVQVNSDKTQMFNAGVFTGKDGLSLNDVEISEKNADGIEEFYSRKGNPCLYAPLAMNRYRATMRAEGQDNWIRKDFSTEYENINDLKAYALRTLKQYAYPLITYTASVQSKFIGNYSDLALGDTVKIIDNNFAGGLALEARVSEMIISFDNPNNNSIVFTNYRIIDNKPTSALQSRIDKVVEDRLPYRIELATTGGTTFKNNEGETTVKPSLYKGNLPYTTDVTWRWALDGVVTVGMQYLARAENIDGTAVLTVSAYIGNNEVATTEITLTNVNDGVQGPRGPKGEQGIAGATGATGAQGPKGADGKTSYIHIKYSPVPIPKDSQITDTPNAYIGVYTDYNPNDSNKASAYTWSKWQGEDGAQGVQGPKGTDGKTSYIHFAYANSADGKTNFSTTYFSGALYVGTLTDYNSADSTTYSAYTWSRLKGDKGDKGDKGETGERGPQGIQGLQGPKGDQGIQGPKGADGKTQYTHIAYANNATGGGFSQTDQTKAYIGMYVDFNATDSTDPTKYKWSKWKGSDGAQGIPGAPGADGKTPYIHFAYADDDKGTNFSLTDKNQQYQGYYSDYTEADSSDYTKYKWVDRLANIQIGGENLLTGTRDWSSNIKIWANNNGVWNDEPEEYNNLKVKSTTGGWNGWHQNVFVKAGEYYTLSYYAKSDANISVKNSLTWEQSPIFEGPVANFAGSNNVSDNITTDWKRYSRTVKITGDGSLQWRIEYDGITVPSGKWYIAGMKLERGNIATDYSPAPEDTQEQIDSKADQTLTQEQLNALEAKRLQMETEMKALATLQQVSELETFINNLKKEDLDGRQKIIEIAKAIEERVKDIEPIMEYSQKLKFMDTYITQGNGGMVIGANESTTKVVVTPDRISFQSGGSEVAYISQRMLHIDNGVFTMSLQLGHYITRAHPRNEYVNATYFVK